MSEQNLLEHLLKKKGGNKQKEEQVKKKKKGSSFFPTSSKPKAKSKSFEIMLKIAGGGGSGHGHNADQLKACLHYIIKGSQDKVIETTLGEELEHKNVDELVEFYSKDFKQSPLFFFV